MRAIKWTSILGEKGNRFFDIRSSGSATTLPDFKESTQKRSWVIPRPFLIIGADGETRTLTA
jgi:hypothetical protein